jgi:predicted nucleic acid-binding protein
MKDVSTLMLTYIDSCVLITAFAGIEELSQLAMAIIDDQERSFASSAFVRLEVLPKPVYYNRQDAIEFYETFFRNVSVWAEDLDKVVGMAVDEASKHDMSPIDALHVAAAKAARADQLVTAEKIGKPMFRCEGLSVRSIFAEE